MKYALSSRFGHAFRIEAHIRVVRGHDHAAAALPNATVHKLNIWQRRKIACIHSNYSPLRRNCNHSHCHQNCIYFVPKLLMLDKLRSWIGIGMGRNYMSTEVAAAARDFSCLSCRKMRMKSKDRERPCHYNTVRHTQKKRSFENPLQFMGMGESSSTIYFVEGVVYREEASTFYCLLCPCAVSSLKPRMNLPVRVHIMKGVEKGGGPWGARPTQFFEQ